MHIRTALGTACALTPAAMAFAPVVDGTRDAEYGPAVAVQQVQTQFGDATPPGNLGGSELNAAYVHVAGGRLHLMLTGNQETNFNKLSVFFDSVAGGENVLSSTPEYDFIDSVGGVSPNFGGMTFDTGFTADCHLISAWGGGGTPGPFSATFVNRQGGGSAMVPGSSGSSGAPAGLVASGSIAPGNLGPNASATALTQALHFAINNSNAAGVTGGTGAADQAAAAAVATGMEFSIALADLGIAPDFVGFIKVSAMIGNGDHNYLSNQFLGALAGGVGNLGGDGAGGFTGTLSEVNLNDSAGDQYFLVFVPTPSGAALLGIALAAAVRRGR